MGTFHKLSPKQLNRYVQEFVDKRTICGIPGRFRRCGTRLRGLSAGTVCTGSL